MQDIIEPNFEVEVEGYVYIGRGPGLVGGMPGWTSGGGVIYRCARFGSWWEARNEDFSCKCGAMRLDSGAARFGSNLGDMNILVYQKRS